MCGAVCGWCFAAVCGYCFAVLLSSCLFASACTITASCCVNSKLRKENRLRGEVHAPLKRAIFKERPGRALKPCCLRRVLQF